MIGKAIRRREDAALLRGNGSYVGDIDRPDQLHLAILRSPHAHARIRGVDVDEAADLPGVVRVFTASDLTGQVQEEPAVGIPADARRPARPLLATDTVRYVGEPVAIVVADTPNAAADGCERIDVDFDPLQTVADGEAALAPGAPVIHTSFPDNIALRHAWSHGDVDTAFANAAHVVHLRLVNQRIVPAAMETRGCVAEFTGNMLTVWAGTQTPHRLRAGLSHMLLLPETQVRVIAPDVGGGFGGKIGFYRDEILCAYAAKTLGRPVKLILARTEDLLTTTQGRGQVNHVDVAAAANGAVTAIRCRTIAELGAYLEPKTPQPPINTGRLITGPYRIPAAAYDLTSVFSNKMATAPYRGAGRPEATYILERAMDAVARECQLDPAEVRRRNLIPADEFPYTTPSGMIYDSGRYEVALDRAMEIGDYPALLRRRDSLRVKGRYLGVGLSCFTEHAGLGPGGTGLDAGWEYGAVLVAASGKVTLKTGASPQGQGIETALSQIASEKLGVPLENINVQHSDTALIPAGMGTFASRSICVGGAAIVEAAESIIEKARDIASDLLEAAAADLEWRDGGFSIRGVPGRSVHLTEIVKTCGGLEDATEWQPPAFTFPSGTHIAVVEVDPETGVVSLQRMVAVDDCGVMINPMIVEGQVHGGLAQGIGQALFEQMHYDNHGQCTTATFMDYATPKADSLPAFEVGEMETPSPINPLGAKGCGETGAIGAPAAIVNAVLNALAPFGVTHLDMPLTSQTVWNAIQAAKNRARNSC